MKKDARKTAIAIVELFEDLLEKHHMQIPDADRDGHEGEAPIYGATWDEIVQEVSSLIEPPCEGEKSLWVHIWYSWGDQESPVEVPEGTDAWEYLKSLVMEEIAVSQEDYPHGCVVWMHPDERKVVLKYLRDDECCFYLISDSEEFVPEEEAAE